MASSPSSSSSALPTAALVLKATCDERTKRLVWPAAPLQALRWDACRRRLAEALQFAQTDFRVEWRDDDGDVVSCRKEAQRGAQDGAGVEEWRGGASSSKQTAAR
jgi:hypothetical protein